jgi:hypothetical protein
MHLIIEEYIIQGKEIKKKLRLVHIKILDTKLCQYFKCTMNAYKGLFGLARAKN